MIVEMGEDGDDLTVIWWTPLSPCIGAYIPIFLQSGEIPQSLQIPAPPATVRPPEEYQQSTFDPSSYWWRFQNLLDAAKGDSLGSRFTERQQYIRARFDALEHAWVYAVEELRKEWQKADSEERIRLAHDLRDLTFQAVNEVDMEIEKLLTEYATAERSQSLHPRWA